jgi:hypothetical protein
VFPVIDQRPLLGAIIAKPVVFHAALLLPGTHEWRYRRLPRFGQSLGLDQKQFSFSKFEEGFRTLLIGALA